MTIAEALAAAEPEVIEATRYGATRHWIKMRAVLAVVACPHCGRAAGERCLTVRERRTRPIADLHRARYALPEAIEVVAGIDEMYAAARAAR